MKKLGKDIYCCINMHTAVKGLKIIIINQHKYSIRGNSYNMLLIFCPFCGKFLAKRR